jgi:hypothetical protein
MIASRGASQARIALEEPPGGDVARLGHTRHACSVTLS